MIDLILKVLDTNKRNAQFNHSFMLIVTTVIVFSQLQAEKMVLS